MHTVASGGGILFHEHPVPGFEDYPRAAITPLSFHGGTHYCVDDWHVVRIAIAQGVDNVFFFTKEQAIADLEATTVTLTFCSVYTKKRSFTMKLFRITCCLVVLLLSLVVFSFVAVHPARAQELNPPPPPEYSCRAGANVTICQADVTISYGPVDIGIVCGSGKSAFDIFDSATGEQHKIRSYDQNGNLTRRVIHEDYTFGQWSNPQTGKVVPYTQHDTITDVLAVPGDLTSATETLTGENIYRAGSGAPVLINAGRQVFNFDESVLFFSAGHIVLRLPSSETSPTAFDDVCAALA